MMELKSWFMTLLTAALLLTGGQDPARNPARPMRVVTQVSIQTPDAWVIRYHRQEKMGKVLNYLRHTDPWDPPARNPGSSEPVVRITVSLSDGSQVHYAQWGTEYLRKGQGPWMKIHPERGLRLWLILAAVPGDSVTGPGLPATPAPGSPPGPDHPV
ncbi:MAG: hypothetical protein IKC09_02325 [Oscillospiraceae bacterium]|nr:hypothetical protein [Oscillospiraceae bacterium]